MTVADQAGNPRLSTASGKIPANSDLERTPLQEWGVLNINFLYFSVKIALCCYENDGKQFAS